MVELLTSLMFAGAFGTAVTVIIAMFQSHGEKMLAALRLQQLGRQPAPWRVPPRRPARSGSARLVRQIGLNRAAA